MPTTNLPTISYSRDFMTRLGSSLLFVPLTTAEYHLVLDAFMWELISFYDDYKTVWAVTLPPEDVDLVRAFPVQRLVDRLRKAVGSIIKLDVLPDLRFAAPEH